MGASTGLHGAGELLSRITQRQATIGVIGLGYVGLPLVRGLWRADFSVVGCDIDSDKVDALDAGKSYIRHFPDAGVQAMSDSDRFSATGDFSILRQVDVMLICVPTPLTRYREPDLSYVIATTESILPYLRAGQLIVLESTIYPGATKEVVQPILEGSGLEVGRDIFLAFSPEREDPGNPNFETATIPKVVGADDVASRVLAQELYGSFITKVVPVSSAATAEAVKLSENIFRSVNIALVNELKLVFERMGINVWEVIDAAKTKPFGYMPFYPGPGLGGHCVPIDPFYLTWKAREYSITTRFIELAGEINTAMPSYVVERLAFALDDRLGKGLKGARILIAGIAYKKNVDDMRESPALVIMEMLQARKADVAYFDPFIPVIGHTREHNQYAGMRSVNFDKATIEGFDAVLICTDHDEVDYQSLVNWSGVVVDTRNATRAVSGSLDRIVRA
ncbi:nucleotide sugar dehydrogenase [Shinella zoogloeoides]|uniref:Nucleotide sugar dehydrogenase n=1 Tax=Shinella zoogloeoides TaxID=352475 RepID=A0A6N8TJW2_SHIZO|nr:nucleotide sugar dehydrogenase [Shinella zoogloeoides]MXO02715.1 nucleotide sugar dehydrogenase [Shinella zoogloeoides]UEX83765.1 nucleotide sugar dehydrogenase [Shinella zoogloeoides]